MFKSETTEPRVEVSTDPARLDVGFVHGFITRSYWAKGRTLAEVQTTIAHSLCFGLYLDGAQIGFARVLSDRVFFGYLLDVFVDEAHRGRGYSLRLLDAVFDHPELRSLQVWRLGTLDAHETHGAHSFGLVGLRQRP